MRPRTGSPSRRLDFLDGLRGVAVGLVLLQHVGELCFPAVRAFTSSTVALGQLGVMVFFLCSGFIIPASLERSHREGRRAALRTFWIGRAFRLYPLYWASLAAAAVLMTVGRHVPAERLSATDWLANAALLQVPTGAPHALGLYWTLAFEMVFYAAVSVLFVLGWHRRSVLLSLAASAGCLGAAALAGPLLGRPAPLGLFCLATMFLGTVVHRWHAGEVRLGALLGCVTTTLAGGAALLASSGSNPAPMLTAWLGAYAVFAAGVALRRRAVPGWLLRLGTISYSVYLVQAVVLLAVPATPHPLLTAALWIAGVLLVSEATHRLVEQPTIRLGRLVAARSTPRAGAAVPIRPDVTVRPYRPARSPGRIAV